VADAMTRYRPQPVQHAEPADMPLPRMAEIRQRDLDDLMDLLDRMQRNQPVMPLRPSRLSPADLIVPEGTPGRSLATEVCARLARDLCQHVFDCPALLMRARPRGTRKLAFARQVAMHLVHTKARRHHEDVARSFARNRSTASHHFEVMEDLRQVLAFDEFLNVLESRYELALLAAELNPKRLWRDALVAMQASLRLRRLDEDDQAAVSYVVTTFKAEAA
jgi:hypothetical protein